MGDAFRSRFPEDATELAADLDRALAGDSVDELFRIVHSIKSIAAQAGFDAIADSAHRVENRLEAHRREESDPTPETRREISGWLGKVRLTIDELSRGEDVPEMPSLTLFERELLDDGLRQGERFYQMTCSINPESPMKSARAHLVVSNLELIANVLKSDPPLSRTTEDDFRSIQVLFTADVDERELYDAVNVDEIDNVRLTQLSGGGIRRGEAPGELPADRRRVTGPYRIDTRTFDWIQAKLIEAEGYISKSTQPETAGSRRLRNLISGVRDTLVAVAERPLLMLFERLEHSAVEISEQTGKKIRVRKTGGDFPIDSRYHDGLFEPLLHIIRNSVDHGIETPDLRAQNGKSGTGLVEMSGMQRNDIVRIEIRDDGKGIDWEALRNAARSKGAAVDLNNFIELLGTPGLTTLEAATAVSGRGVGLEVAVQRIRSLGGSIDVESRPGEGTCFTIELPAGRADGSHLILRHGDLHYSVPSSEVARILPFDTALLRRDKRGGVWLERIPIYTATGRLRYSPSLPVRGTVLLLRANRRSAWLLVDDVLFERKGDEQPAIERIEEIDAATLLDPDAS